MDVSKRQNELEKIFLDLDDATRKATSKLIEDIVFLEIRLEELKKLPFIEVNPKNPIQQRPTPAAKQYKELLQQYNNCLKILLSAAKKDGVEQTSPLREYLNSLKSRQGKQNE